MTLYLGYDLLEAPSDAREDPQERMSRSIATFDPRVGRRRAQSRNAAPPQQRSYLWTCQDRAAIASLKAWLLRRKGRLIPFWVPTWRRDVVLHAGVSSTDTAIVIEAMNYTEMMFPSKARRHLAFWAPSGALICRAVTAASNNGSTETLSLSSSLGTSFPKEGLVSFLALSRLDSDDVEITYHTDAVAEARLAFVELPQEAP